MIELITTAEALAHLKITDADYDALDLQGKIAAATGAVLRYLGGANFYQYEVDQDNVPVLDTAGDPVYVIDTAGDRQVLYEVKAAALLMLGYLNRERDADDDKAFEMGFIPRPVTALLYPLRTPVIG